MRTRTAFPLAFSFLLLAATPLTSRAQELWSVGMDDNGWPLDLTGGGPNTAFVQEAGGINPLPGSATNAPTVPATTSADNDYYFAGDYSTIIPANGDYVPVGLVSANEEAAERAFAASDLDLRYHFNLPTTLQPTDRLAVTFDANNLDTSGADPRFGIEVYVNGVLVQPEILIRGSQLGIDYQSSQFTLASVGAVRGPGGDNIVSLRGINYNGEGGGNWMGIDYVKLDQVTEIIPTAVFPWAVGKDDDARPLGNGGGANASFVQGNAATNPLPGSPTSTEVDGGADNDYYLAGAYTNAIAGNGAYAPVGTVALNEEAAEGFLTATETELRYHFNLPNTVSPTSLVAVTFDASALDTGVADARYGVEVYVNGVRVQPQILIRPAQLGKDYTTPQFTLGSVNALIGSGFDNIVSLRGINYSATGGGTRLGIDYLELKAVTTPIPPPALPWMAGLDDNSWPSGDGGGANASFVQGNGTINALPGNPISTEVSGGADNDYYFAGVYSTLIAGNGSYDPVGTVLANEEAAERGFSGADNELRFHFNLPAGLAPTYMASVAFDALDLDTGVADPRYGVEVYVNGVLVQPQTVIRPAQLGTDFITAAFTLASVNAQMGPGFDNILTLKGINFSATGGGNKLGIDFVHLNPLPPSVFPWTVGLDDNLWPFTAANPGNGGGANATFVQEGGGISPLPGNPASPEADQQADNDYYFAGTYNSVIADNGVYDPVGVVLVNEEAVERAFAATDNDLRYHFNLPNTLLPTDRLSVAFDALNLHTDAADPRYGIEVYFNNVLVQPEIIIRPAELNKYYAVPAFTLASVNAQVGPGADNILSLRGVNYNGDGGGNWMGIDYVQLAPVITPNFPLAVGLDDNAWPFTAATPGTGGGVNATFVQENGAINQLPGKPVSPEVNARADNDYYFAGTYTTVLPANGVYEPVGLVAGNEEAVERAFAAADNDLRYHFNLPSTLQASDQLTVTFDALNLHTDAAVAPDPRYGIEVYFNGVLVLPETLIRQPQLGTDYTTPPFTLASVGAQVGPGIDNIVSLRGINYNGDGGGNWMGIDYVKIDAIANPTAPLVMLKPVVSNGQVTLNWTGTGLLEWSSTLVPPWTPVTPAPNPPYTEAIAPSGVRFFRLRRP